MSADPERVTTGRLPTEAAAACVASLFESHSRLVYGICRLLLRDPDEAEDATQQTFLSAYRSLLAGTEPRDSAAWLGTIARNECRARIRSRMSEPLQLVGEEASRADLERDAGTRTEIAALSEALAGLPQRQREAIVLREFYGLSHQEVGAALNLSPSAVDGLLVRARRRLQAELRPARLAAGGLSVPLALRDTLAQAIPGFGGPGATGVMAKLASLPVAAKLAGAVATVAVVGTAGTLADREHGSAPTTRKAGVTATRVAPELTKIEERALARLPFSTSTPAGDDGEARSGRTGHRADDDEQDGEFEQREDGDERDSRGQASEGEVVEGQNLDSVGAQSGEDGDSGQSGERGPDGRRPGGTNNADED